MRGIFIVAYDVADAKRLKLIFKKMKNWGDHAQFSIFVCHLNETELAKLKMELHAIINCHEDQVMVIHLGPEEGKAKEAIITIGRPMVTTSRSARVI